MQLKTISPFHFCLLLFPILCIGYGDGYNIAGVALFISSLIYITTSDKSYQLSKNEILIISVLIYYFTSFVLLKYIHDEKWRFVDNATRALLIIPILIAAVKKPPTWRHVALSINIASIISSVIALLYQIIYPHLRSFDGSVPIEWFHGYMQIQTGGMVTTFAISSFAILMINLKKKQTINSLISLLAFALASWASLQSGSRGSWVLVPVVMLALAHYKFNLLRPRAMLACFVLTSITLGIVATNDMTRNRINSAIKDLKLYSSGQNNYTSLGIRLDLWKSGIQTFADHPIVGAGKAGRLEERIAHGNSGLIDKKVSLETYHSHNQFIEAASVGGLLSLSALTLLFVVPIYLFIKLMDSHSDDIKNFCLLGLVSTTLMIGYCLSQAYLNHNSGTIFYLAWTTLLLGSAIGLVERENTQET